MISKGVFGLSSGALRRRTGSRREWRVPWLCVQLGLAMVVLFTMARPSFGADTTGAVTISRQRLREFRTAYPRALLKLDPKGTPSTIEGDLGRVLPSGSALEVFYGFMERNKDLFGLKTPRTEMSYLKGNEPNPRTGARSLKFQQMYQGLEVFGAGVGAHFNREGAFHSLIAVVYPNIDLPSDPTITKEQAQEIVTRAVASADSLDLSRCRLIVYPWEGKCHLAWQIVAYPGGEYVIDALKGDVISRNPEAYVPKVRLIDSVPPLKHELGIFPPVGSPHGPRRGPVGEPVDTIPPAPGSPPGTPSGVIYRPMTDSLRRNSFPTRRGAAVRPHDEPPAPADTSSSKEASPPKQQSLSVQEPSSLITIMSEGFEGAFPSGKWKVNGVPTWDDVDCMPHAGYKSAWCARRWGQDPCPGANYPNNLNAWMTYGPFNLSDAKSAELSFWYWLEAETGYDSLFWGASSDDHTYYYYGSATGWSGGWVNQSLSLCDYIGDDSVWIGVWFFTDWTGVRRGAFVDDFVLQKRTDALADLSPYVPLGWDGDIVASSVQGTHTTDPLQFGETAYIDVAWAFNDVGCAGPHRSRLFVDTIPIPIWTSDPIALHPGYYYAVEDIPYVISATGYYPLTLVIDVDDSVPESDETNNTSNLWLSVGCWPGPVTGTGCSVVPGVSHPVVEAYCSGAEFDLTDWSRIPSGTSYLRSYLWKDSTNPRLFTDRDNVWDDSAHKQCEGVDAHVYSGLTYDYMRDYLGRDSYDDNGASMIAVVDDGLPRLYNNSAWDDTNHYVTVGRPGPGRRSIAGCLDGIAHEWGHAITQNTSHLVSEKESGALSESFSDMLGVSVGFAYGDDDYLLGEDSYTNGQAMRNMADPLQYGQPDTYHDTNWVTTDPCVPDTTNDRCGIHKNSGVPNKMFYLLAHGGTQNNITVQGIGITEAMWVMYYANTDKWYPNTLSLYQAFQGSVVAANDLDPSGYEGRQVMRAWGAVKVCDCTHQGDVNDDTVIDVFDVIQEIAIAFSGWLDITDPTCLTSRSDVNYDDFVDVFDVIQIIAIAFSGDTVNNPCAP